MMKRKTAIWKPSEKAFITNANVKYTKQRRRLVSVPADAERDMPTRDRLQAMADARLKIEEHPIAGGILRASTDFVVGGGYTLNVLTDDSDVNKRIEQAFKTSSESLDVRGIRSFGHLQRAWYQRMLVDGDVFIVRLDSGKIQTIEADRCYKERFKADDTGIDFDEYGAPVRYYFGRRSVGQIVPSDSAASMQSAPIDSGMVYHYANWLGERVERMRGVSAFLQIINLMEDYNATINAMAQKVKNEAFIGLAFKTEPLQTGGILGATGEETRRDESGTDRRFVKLDPGLNLNLAEGESVEVIESKSPHAEFIQFLRYRVREMGLTFGLPLEYILMDSSEANYSGLKAMAANISKTIKFRQAEMQRLCSWVFRWWCELNGYDVNTPHTWGVPAIGFVDPLKEAQTYGYLIDRNLISRQDAIAELGIGSGDFENTVVQIVRENDLMNEQKLPYALGLPGSIIINSPVNATSQKVDQPK